MVERDREELIKAGRNNRRRARDEILDAIQEDKIEPKVYLRLLLTVVEEIGDKIDTILADEQSLRATVLNGHEPTHHSDHDWVQSMRKANCSEVCEWSRKKMEAEAEAEKAAVDLVKAGKKAAIEQMARMAVIGLVGVMTGVAGVLWALK